MTEDGNEAVDGGTHGVPLDGSVADPATTGTATAATRRVIKRYSNRKLYDTQQSRYVTLLQIAELVRAGEELQIIDNATKEDKTDITLALIISEELKAQPRAIPLSTLRALIRNRGERLMNQLRDSPFGLLIPAEQKTSPACAAPAEGTPPPEGMLSSIRDILPPSSVTRDLRQEIQRLTDRVSTLEGLLAKAQSGPSDAPADNSPKTDGNSLRS